MRSVFGAGAPGQEMSGEHCLLRATTEHLCSGGEQVFSVWAMVNTVRWSGIGS